MILAAGGGVEESTVAFVLIDTALIIAVARLAGGLFKRLGQPPVIGEIIAGLALGPSLLGSQAVTDLFGLGQPLTDTLFPTEARPFLKVLAEVGLVFFMFIIGLELDMKLIRGKERLAAGVSLTSVAVPFGLGFLLALALEDQGYKPSDADFLPFAMFIGASMSVTAFPVLARILSERRMHRTPIGVLALACAAIDDILAWSLLALVTAVVQASMTSEGGGGNVFGDLLAVLVPSVLFVAFMFLAVKPLLATLPERFRRAGNRLTPEALAVVLGGVLVSSWVTSEIGIHSIFGAFLMGAVMPREGAAEFTHALVERIESVAVLVLLPLFFIVTGLAADIGDIDASGFGMLALVVAVACLGKFCGATVAGRVQGLSTRRAAAVGILMNTRGLTELVLLSIGLDKGVLSPELFTLLVLMAVVTTLMTAPILKRIYPERMLEYDIAEAEREALGEEEAYRVLVLVEDPDRAGDMVSLASQVAASEPPAEVVLSRLRAQPAPLEAGAGALATRLVLMAESMDDLHGLEGQVSGDGLRATSFSQFTDDVARDLTGQAERQAAKLVLVSDHRDDPGRPDLLERLAADVPADLAVVVAPAAGRDGTGSGTVAEAADAAAGQAALEYGVRRAAGAGHPPAVVGAGTKPKVGRSVRAAIASLEPADARALVHDAEVDAAVDSGGLAAPEVVFRAVEGTELGEAVTAARHDADRWGARVVLVRPDPNQFERTGLEDYLAARAERAADPLPAD